jgi:hypothetical protein
MSAWAKGVNTYVLEKTLFDLGCIVVGHRQRLSSDGSFCLPLDGRISLTFRH